MYFVLLPAHAERFGKERRGSTAWYFPLGACQSGEGSVTGIFAVLSPSREPGVPATAAARLAALAGREQGAEQSPQRFPLEPQPFLQDFHPSQLTGTPFRLPTRLLFHFISRPLQPAPFHLPTNPS